MDTTPLGIVDGGSSSSGQKQNPGWCGVLTKLNGVIGKSRRNVLQKPTVVESKALSAMVVADSAMVGDTLSEWKSLEKQLKSVMAEASVLRILATWRAFKHCDFESMNAEEIFVGRALPGETPDEGVPAGRDCPDPQGVRRYELIVLDGPWEHDCCEGLSMSECGFGPSKLNRLCYRLSHLLTDEGTVLLFCSSVRQYEEWRVVLEKHGFDVGLRPLIIMFAPRCTLVESSQDCAGLGRSSYFVYVVTRRGALHATRHLEHQGFEFVKNNQFPAMSQVISGYEKPPRKECLRGQGGEHFDISEKSGGLCLELILRYTNQLDTVLDLFAGSGAFAAACIKSMRYYVGCEANATVFGAASLRLEVLVRRMFMSGVLNDPQNPGSGPRDVFVPNRRWKELAEYLEAHQRLVAITDEFEKESGIVEEQAEEWRRIEQFSGTLVYKKWTGPERGYGLFARKRMSKGQFFGCYGGVIVSRAGMKATAKKRGKTPMQLDRRIELMELAKFGRLQHLNPEIIGSGTGLMGFMNCARGPGNYEPDVFSNVVFRPCLWEPELRAEFLRLVAQGNPVKAWGYPYMMTCYTSEVVEKDEELKPDYGVGFWFVPDESDSVVEGGGISGFV